MKKRTVLCLILTFIFILSACSTKDNTNNVNNADNNKTSEERNITLTETEYYPESYTEEVLNTINTVNNKITGESVSYIFITDIHMDTSEETQVAAYRELNALVDVANNTDIDFVCIGGDMYNGRDAGTNGKQVAMDKIESIAEILEKCNKPVFMLKGNHDDNSFSAQEDDSLLFDADYIINRDEWYSVTMKHFSQYAQGYQNGYFYYDLPDKNTRVVCLNMSDSDDTVTDGKQNQMGMYYYGYQNEQIQWLLDEAMSRQDCNYMFMCHDAFDYPQGYGADSNRDTLQAILKAAYTHTAFNMNGFEKDFSNWNGNVVLYNSGHLHMERAIRDEETGGLPLLNTQSGMYAAQSRGWMFDKGYSMVAEKVKDTAQEALFNVVISTGDDIQIVRFGAGEDHSLE